MLKSIFTSYILRFYYFQIDLLLTKYYLSELLYTKQFFLEIKNTKTLKIESECLINHLMSILFICFMKLSILMGLNYIKKNFEWAFFNLIMYSMLHLGGKLFRSFFKHPYIFWARWREMYWSSRMSLTRAYPTAARFQNFDLICIRYFVRNNKTSTILMFKIKIKIKGVYRSTVVCSYLGLSVQ